MGHRVNPASGDEIQRSVEASFPVHVLPAVGGRETTSGTELGAPKPPGAPSSDPVAAFQRRKHLTGVVTAQRSHREFNSPPICANEGTKKALPDLAETQRVQLGAEAWPCTFWRLRTLAALQITGLTELMGLFSHRSRGAELCPALAASSMSCSCATCLCALYLSVFVILVINVRPLTSASQNVCLYPRQKKPDHPLLMPTDSSLDLSFL